jgi:hypothetical protein
LVDGYRASNDHLSSPQLETVMQKIIEAAAEVAKATVLDCTITAADLRENKKNVAAKLAKSLAWMFIQNHPLYIAIKLALWGLAAFAAVVLAIVAYFVFT